MFSVGMHCEEERHEANVRHEIHEQDPNHRETRRGERVSRAGIVERLGAPVPREPVVHVPRRRGHLHGDGSDVG